MRQKGIYPYDLMVDLREPGPDEPIPVIHHLYDGQQFDLGGRVVTAYECFGHSPGEMIFLLLNGTYSPVIVPSRWGPGRPDQIMVLRGRNMLGYNPDKIHEPKNKE